MDIIIHLLKSYYFMRKQFLSFIKLYFSFSPQSRIGTLLYIVNTFEVYLQSNNTARSSTVRTLLPTVQEAANEQNSEKEQTQSRDLEEEKKAMEMIEKEKEVDGQRAREQGDEKGKECETDRRRKRKISLQVFNTEKRNQYKLKESRFFCCAKLMLPGNF